MNNDLHIVQYSSHPPLSLDVASAAAAAVAVGLNKEQK